LFVTKEEGMNKEEDTEEDPADADMELPGDNQDLDDHEMSSHDHEEALGHEEGHEATMPSLIDLQSTPTPSMPGNKAGSGADAVRDFLIMVLCSGANGRGEEVTVDDRHGSRQKPV
jgi:hypothetical protein